MSDDYDYKIEEAKSSDISINVLKQRIYDKKISLYKALVTELERAKGEKSDQQILFLKSHITLLDGLL